MSTYHAIVRWSRGLDAFAGYKYSRGHEWVFDEGVVVPASASPQVVRAPYSVAAAVDPEEAFIAALSSCQMLFFLAYAAKAGSSWTGTKIPPRAVSRRTRPGKKS